MILFRYLPLISLVVIVLWYIFSYNGEFKNLWISPDREASEFLKKGKVEEALKTYENQLSIGAIYYQKGEFKKALSVYETLGSKEAFYNRGNTLMMLGKYNEAIEAYKLALEAEPNYKEAKENMLLAKNRQAILDGAKDEGNREGTGGKLGADKIVFDNKNNQGESIEENGAVNQNEAGVAWLDRLETSPAKFLEAKFSYQLQTQEKKK
ncbi:MAG: tetratricopeptide repeat protein [Campylobacterota bacterium]|nr:tetratricopeptide repeat protein [Campylobacterota bacterium]